MKNNVRQYQKNIIDGVEKLIKDGRKEIVIQMAAGTGKSIVIKSFLQCLEPLEKVLILVQTRVLVQKWKNICCNECIKVCTYSDELLQSSEKMFIILDNAEIISNEEYDNLEKLFPNSVFIYFFSTINFKDSWLKSKNIDFSYTLQDAFREGYINPRIITNGCLEKLVYKLLILSNYIIDIEPRIDNEKCAFRPDFIISNESGKKIVEVKEDRSECISRIVLSEAVEQVRMYGNICEKFYNECVQSILVVSCFVSNDVKKKYYEKYNVLIIDISNLIYLVQDDDNMMKQLIECVHYDISSINPEEILNISFLKTNNNVGDGLCQCSKAIEFINKLESLPYGKINNSDKEYEKLCTDIINYLFKSDFTKMIDQHSTDDKMFQMDLICGLKGTSEFWKNLIQHYNTRFVVFEFKNYEEEISQNLIYVAEKYLYDATLRNVAIIISRKGFSNNAHKAANGILTENKKLVIDLSDEDIIAMLRMKADKEDASDYMLDKLEEWLMSISK